MPTLDHEIVSWPPRTAVFGCTSKVAALVLGFGCEFDNVMEGEVWDGCALEEPLVFLFKKLEMSDPSILKGDPEPCEDCVYAYPSELS